MKYFHVIYNSSEKGVEGGRGFCFRTYTEGTPTPYLNALQENELLGYQQGNCEQIMPQTLKNEPESIKAYPTSYFFRKLTVEGGKHIFVLGRTIPVGFDYTFYMKYVPGRMGNYVTDCYLFEEQPSSDVFQILYENPAQGSNRFVPQDPSPRESNEEMKALSLGSQPFLPLEEKPFVAASLAPISPLAVKILFALVEAQRLHKVLAVKSPWKEAAPLMADLYRLLPDDLIDDFGFVSNYQEEGLPKHTPIVWVNEFYDYALSKNLSVCFDTASEWTETDEYQLFGKGLERDLSAGDKEAVFNCVRWMLSGAYFSVMDKSKETNTAFYQYCVTPDAFSLNALKGNDELVAVLANYISKEEKYREPLFSLVDAKMASASNEREVALSVNFLEEMRKKQIDLSSIAEKYKPHFSQIVFSSVETFVASADKVDGGLSTWTKYLDRGVLAKKNAFLDDPRMKVYWKDLYRLFYPEDDQKGDARAKVVRRMVDCGLEPKTILEVLKDLYADNEKYASAETMKSAMGQEPDKVEAYWALLTSYLAEGELAKLSSDFMDCFSAQLSNDKFAPLFYKQLTLNGLTLPLLEALPRLKQVAEGNKRLKSLMEEGFDTEKKLFPALLSEFWKQVRENEQEAVKQAECLKDSVLGFYSDSVTKDWRTLYILLRGEEKEVTEKNCEEVTRLAGSLRAKASLERLLDRLISLTKKEQTSMMVDLFGELLGMNLDDMLARVASVKELKDNRNFLQKILLKNGVDVKTAVQLAADKKINVGSESEADKFFEECYGDQYHSYKRKQVIVGFAKKLFHRG